jgi:tetratricopeptide (TPR) repeat protein
VLRAQTQQQAIPSGDVVDSLTQAALLDAALLDRARGDRLFDPLRGDATFDTAIYGSGAAAARWFDGHAQARVVDGALDEAALDYTRAISYALQYADDPDRLSSGEIVGLYVSLSEVYLLRDPRSEQAVAALRAALEVADLDPLQTSGLHVRLSELYLARDPFSEEALLELQAAASVAGLPASQAADYYVRASDVYRQRNRFDQAVEALNRAATAPGLSPSRASMLYVSLSALYAQSDRFDEAAQTLLRAAGVEGLGTGEAIQLYRNVADLYVERDRFEEAARALEQAVVLQGVSPNDLFGLYFTLSNLYRQANQPDRAADALNKAAGIEGLLPAQVLVGQGRIYLEDGQYAAARDQFAQASELAPADAAVWYDYARALAALGDAGSEAALRRAIALDFNLAATARNTDDWDRYFASASSAVQNLITAALRVKDARALRDQGQLDQAIAAYQEATALDPSSVDYWSELGRLLAQAKRPSEAVIAYQNALGRLDERDPALLTALGQAQFDAGDFASAIQSLTEAISLQGDATPARTYVSLARAFESFGSFDVAAETYAQALLRDPNNLSYIYRIGVDRLLAGQGVQGQEALRPIIAQGGLRVEATDGAPLREAPGVEGPLLKTLAVGSVLRIAGDPQVVAGQVWWPVIDPQETLGWVRAASVAPSEIAATLVTPTQVAPSPTP